MAYKSHGTDDLIFFFLKKSVVLKTATFLLISCISVKIACSLDTETHVFPTLGESAHHTLLSRIVGS